MDDKRIAFLRRSETGAITDAMYILGVDGWMDGILPVRADMKIAGRAFTVQFATVRDPDQKVYNIFEVFDICKPGDVIVVSAAHPDATVGENMIHDMENKGGVGMILDGKVRDYGVLSLMGTPVFSRGPAIRVAQNFKVTAVQVPVLCGGIVVQPGDYIVGDVDGVIAVPQDRIDDVIFQAEHVTEVEAALEEALNNRVPTPDLIKISARKKSPRPTRKE